MSLSFNSRSGTFEMTEDFFGKSGALFSAYIMAFTFCAWFVLQFDNVKFFLYQTQSISYPLDSLFLLFFAAIVLLGVYGLFVVAALLVPVAIAGSFFVIIFFPTTNDVNIASNARFYNLFDLSVLTPLLSGLSVTILALPTLSRFIRTRQEIVTSLKIAYLILLPFASGIGIVLGFLSPYNNPLILGLGHDNKWFIVMVLYMLITTCTTNVMNLYFAADAAAYFTKSKSKLFAVFLVSSVCFIFMKFVELVPSVIELLNAIIASILTIIIVSSTKAILPTGIILQKNNITVLGLSVATLYFCYLDYIVITGILFCDAIIVSTVLCLFSVSLASKQRIGFE
jgi:hypothetical protein